jgi:hypothetical protein
VKGLGSSSFLNETTLKGKELMRRIKAILGTISKMNLEYYFSTGWLGAV